MVVAAVFNSMKNVGYSKPPSGNPFDAFYIDAAAGATPGDPGSNQVTEEFTHTVFLEEGTASWCGPCVYAKDALHAIYESAAASPSRCHGAKRDSDGVHTPFGGIVFNICLDEIIKLLIRSS